MSATTLALLRGINVGGRNKLPMPALRDLFTAAECRDVQTHIQSGNVLFRADPDTVAAVPDTITAQIAARFGYRVPVILRTVAQLDAVIQRNPFLAQGAAEDTLHVLFLAGQPEARTVAALDAHRSAPDEFAVREQEVYLYLPNGAARTTLTNGYFETKLATVSTGRNWRTATRLLALMRE